MHTILMPLSKLLVLNKLYKDIYGDKKGETNFNNIVKQFEEVGKNLTKIN